MKLSNQSVFYLLLIPAPWFCQDFIEPLFLYALSALLAIRVFTALPSPALLITAAFLAYKLFQLYQPRLVPESAVSFLALMVAVKLCQKEATPEPLGSPAESKRFKTSLIFGILWAGSFALFNNTLYYLAYLTFFFILWLRLFKLEPNAPFKFHFRLISIKKIGSFKPLLNLLKVLPLITALFVFFPRFRGFLPGSSSGNTQSKVGYSKEINNSNTSNLQLSDKVAFYAQTDRQLSSELLYWRGRSHTQTDGYNWRSQNLPAEKELPIASEQMSDDRRSLEYEIKYAQEFGLDAILLETPLRVGQNSGVYQVQGSGSYRFYNRRQKLKVKAISFPGGHIRSTLKNNKRAHLALPGFLPNSFLDLAKEIKGESAKEILLNFSIYLKRNGFSYTLSPGQLPTMASFIKSKKGFCSHYAALLGALLRHKGIPSRLISGFQGGEYNPAGGFYTIRSRDAHAWVEYYDEKDSTWRRSDPTGFISPERIAQGGSYFSQREGASVWARLWSPFQRLSAGLKSFDQALANINYKLAAFLDDFDRMAQKQLAANLRLNLKDFYMLGAALAILFGAFLYLMVLRRNTKDLDYEDKDFRKFRAKLNKLSISFEKSAGEEKIKALIREKALPMEFIDFLNLYQKIKYSPPVSNAELKRLRRRLRKLRKGLPNKNHTST